ncbi:hypothetical protein, partial [Streptomyces sp. NPDC001833]|uniref:hypothetical protein n=1 Tax=Streptomyces sp. NPDC001833 TaxID=3154658 RepID=UPI0033326899
VAFGERTGCAYLTALGRVVHQELRLVDLLLEETLKEQIRALNDKIKGQEQLNNQVSKKWYQFWK